MFVSAIEMDYKSTETLPDIRIELANEISVGESFVQKVAERALTLIANPTTTGGLAGGGGLPMSIADKRYIRRDVPDRTEYKLQSDVGFEVGSFVTGASGGIFYRNPETGKSYIEVDELKVRMKAVFEELEIAKIKSIGGKFIVTPGGAINISYVEDFTDVYRCYFKAKEETVGAECRFEAGDLVRCQEFNVAAGTQESASNRFYWCRVTAVNNDDSYIELSKTDRDSASVSTPTPGDTICHLGSKTNPQRRSAIVISTIDTFAPCITLFDGIDDYTLEDKAVVEYGVDKTKTPPEPFFNCYGRFYYGPRDRQSYLEFNPSLGSLVFKGSLSIESLFGDKTLPDYLAENTDSTNFLLKTVEFNDWDIWFEPARIITDSGEEWQGVTTYRMSGSFSPVQVFGDAVPGEKYTFSAWIKEEGDAMPGQVRLATFTPGGSYTPVTGAEAQRYSVLADLALGEWRRVKATFTAPADGKLCIGIWVSAPSSSVTRMGGFKLEKGEIATSWSPAPSDNDTSKFEYLREAMKQNTKIKGGLVQTSTVILGQQDSDGGYTVWSGTNGLYHNGTTPAFFAGGDMIDKEYDSYSASDRPAAYMIRMDGTGYAAGGAIRFTDSSMRVGEYAYMNKDGFSIVGNDGVDIMRLSNLPIGTINELSNAAVSTRYISAISRDLDVNYGGEGFGISFSGTTSQAITLTLGNIQPGQKLSAQLSVFLNLANIDFDIPTDPFALYVCPNLVVEVIRTSDSEVVYSSKHRVQPAAHGSDVHIIDDILFRCDAEAASVHQLRVRFDKAVTSSETHATASMNWPRTPAYVYTYSKKQTLLGNNGFASAWGETLVFADSDQILLRAGNFNFRIHKDSGFGYNTDGSNTFKKLDWT